MRLARPGRRRTSPTAPTSTRARAGPRCGRTSSATSSPCKRAGGAGPRRSASASGSRRAAAEALDDARGARRAPRVPRRARSLRLHDQRLSVRAVPRHAGEGAGLPARLARAGAARLHRPPRAISWPRSCPTSGARRQRQHGAGRVQAHACGRGRGWRRWPPSRDPRTRPSASAARARPAAPSRSRSSPSPAASSRPSPRPSPSSRSSCLGAGAACASWRGSPALGAAAREAALRRHLGVCFDACHAAVEFEDPAAVVALAARAGIRIAKMQLSAASRISAVDGAATRRARGHSPTTSTCTRWSSAASGTLTRSIWTCREALAGVDAPRPSAEWRVHFHVPIFRRELGAFANTQGVLGRTSWRCHRPSRSRRISRSRPTPGTSCRRHYRDEPTSATAIARELAWVTWSRLPR